MRQIVAFATGVPPYIYAFHRYTWNSVNLSCTLVYQFLQHALVEPLPFTADFLNRLLTLYAQ